MKSQQSQITFAGLEICPCCGQPKRPKGVEHPLPDCPANMFPNVGKSSGGRIGNAGGGVVTNIPTGTFTKGDPGYGDTGSAARFFYCAKASKQDRDEGLEGWTQRQRDDSRQQGDPGGDNPRNRGAQLRSNNHPTVKPTSLMRWLVRLVTPPGGTVLDPFMGSGSTGKAAMLEGFDFFGMELDPEYLEIARARIEFAIADQAFGLFAVPSDT